MAAEGVKRRLAALLAKRFFLRFHFSLILGLAFCAGLLTTRALLSLGLESLTWRWPLAVLGAYAGFLLGVRLWLSWIGLGRVLDRDEEGEGIDPTDLADLNLSGGGSGSGSVSLPDLPAPAEVAAGEFGGGGASDSFAAVGDGGGSLLPDVDLPDLDLGGGDDGCLPIVLLFLILALLAAVLGIGVYMIAQAPAMLAEAAFEAAVAAGMVRSAYRFRDPGWVEGAVRSSWKPFLLIFVMAAGVAGTLHHFVPEATTLLEAVGMLWAAA